MIFFYLLLVIPFVVGGILFIVSNKVSLLEWILTIPAGLVVILIFHCIKSLSIPSDVQTLSGQVTSITFYPRWVERYTQMHTRTVGTGKNAHTEFYTTTEYRTHHEEWVAYDNIFHDSTHSINISRQDYNYLAEYFGSKMVTTTPYKSGFHSGDRNVYTYFNNGKVYPVHINRYFTNKLLLKNAPSSFSFAPVPNNIQVYDHPSGDSDSNYFVSGRLINVKTISQFSWDCLNAELGPKKKVNLILINFGERGEEYAEYQRSKWVGGKKNDLVLCYGEVNGKTSWTKVFGWTESEIVKANLETILLKNNIDDSIIPLIKNEVIANYKIKDWDKLMEYMEINPPTYMYFIIPILLVIGYCFYFYIVITNDLTKDSSKNIRYNRYTTNTCSAM